MRWNMIAYKQSADEFHWDDNNEDFSLATVINTRQVGIWEDDGELAMVSLSNSGSIPVYNPVSASENQVNTIQHY